MDLFEAIHTQRSIRRFKPEPVDDETIRTALDAARKAPSATNAQPWRFVVVRDAGTRKAIAGIYARAWDIAKGFYGDPAKATSAAERRMLEATDRLAGGLDEAPVFVVCCLDRSRLGPMVTPDLQTLLDPASAYGAVWASVQNLLLAARGLGLAAVPTTLHRLFEPEVKDLLGIPPHAETVALVALGRPAQPFGPTSRRPLADVASGERWDEPL